MSALHGAAGLAHEPRLTALLLAAGADPDDGRSLRGAVGAQDPACLELLLDAGARVPGAMALAHAVQRGRLRMARVLLERGPREWGERENALQWAVRPEASAEMVRLLVEHGADLEASFDGTGRTPYAVAARSGRPDLAELLAELGAQRRADALDALMGACLTGDGATARRVATEHPDAAKLLRTAKADVLGRWAADGRREAVEVLLDLGVPVDARGPAGLTALQEATAALTQGSWPCSSTRRGSAQARRRMARAPPTSRPTASSPGRPTWATCGCCQLTAGRARPCGDGLAVITASSRTARTAWSAAAWTVTLTRRSPRRCAGCEDAPRSGCSPIRSPGRPARASRRGRSAPRAHRRGHGRRARPPDARRRAAARPRGRAGARRGRAARVGTGGRARRAAGARGRGPRQPRPGRARAAATPPRAPRRRVVGAASFFAHGETVLGQHLAVAAPERRAGIGRALVQACAREALAAGARVAVVEPTPDTVAFYRLLGFTLRAMAARPLVLPAAAPRVTRRGVCCWVLWALGLWRAGPVGGHGLRLRRLRLRACPPPPARTPSLPRWAHAPA